MGEKQDVMTVNALSNVSRSGRKEMDATETADFRVTEDAVQKIRRLEVSVLTAEERLGVFCVG
ncbi:hypothetical protein [Gluconobacter oxydans]|uniref:hypothetical protein n=1 Tax=Gluconobacter oxydans TaxID=442 RepID=UPI0039E886A1